MCSRSAHVKSLSAPCCGLCWEPTLAVYQYYETKERYPAVEHLSTTCFLFPCLHFSETTNCSTGITTRLSSIRGWMFILTLPDSLSLHHSSLQCFQSECPFKIGSITCGLLFQQDVRNKEHVTMSHHKLMTKKPHQHPVAWIQKAQRVFPFVFSNTLLGQKPLGTAITRFPESYYLLSGL